MEFGNVVASRLGHANRAQSSFDLILIVPLATVTYIGVLRFVKVTYDASNEESWNTYSEDSAPKEHNLFKPKKFTHDNFSNGNLIKRLPLWDWRAEKVEFTIIMKTSHNIARKCCFTPQFPPCPIATAEGRAVSQPQGGKRMEIEIPAMKEEQKLLLFRDYWSRGEAEGLVFFQQVVLLTEKE